MAPEFDLRTLVKDTATLISLPDIYLRLRAVVNDEESTLADVADVLSLDPALCARILRIANSAFYSFPSQIETVTRALSVIGTCQVHDLVLATSISGAVNDLSLGSFDLQRFWHQSVQCGYLTRTLAECTDMKGSEAMFVRGLLADIGRLVLVSQIPEDHQAATTLAQADEIPQCVAERQLWGFDASHVGGALLSEWGLPEPFVASVSYQNEPAQAGEHQIPAALVHIAHQITLAENAQPPCHETLDCVDAVAWKITGLTPAVVNEVLGDASEDMVEAMYRLFTPQAE